MEQSTSTIFPFLCDDCGWSFETNDKLQQHIQQEHMVEYSCSQPVNVDNDKFALNGEHQPLRLHIKRNFISAASKSVEINSEKLSSGTESKEKCDRAICKKCNISFCSKLLFERHLKAHVHESELAVKVCRLQIPDDVLKDVSNSYANQANVEDSTESPLQQAAVSVDNPEFVNSAVSNVGQVSFPAPSMRAPATLAKESASASSNLSSMEQPMSSELLSRSLLDELRGYMKDVTESILTTPHVDSPTKSSALPAVSMTTHVPLPSPGSYPSTPTRDYSQPPAFPRVCSSPTENNPELSTPQAATSQPNPRLSAILQLPNVHNRSNQPRLPPVTNGPHTQAGPGFVPSMANSAHYGSAVLTSTASLHGNSIITPSSSHYGNTITSTNAPFTNSINAYGLHNSGGTQLAGSASITRSLPITNTQTASTSQNAISLHGIPSGFGPNKTLTTIAPSQTDTRLGGALSMQHSQPLNVSGSAPGQIYRRQSVTGNNQGQVSSRAVPARSPGSQRTPPALNASGSAPQHHQPVSGANPLALLSQMNQSVTRNSLQTMEVNPHERPASVVVLENPQENSLPTIHSVVSLQPGYKHESWGNIVVPTSDAGAQHIHQNPSSHCQCLGCRDIRGGDLLRKSQIVDNGRCEYKCPKCNRLFTQKTSFIRHCKSFKHAFICDMCHCGFLSEAPYETHKSLHLLKGLLHSSPSSTQPTSTNRPMNQQMAPVAQQRQYQGVSVPQNQQAAYQQQRRQVMAPRAIPNSSSMAMHAVPKPVSNDADDDVVVLEPEPGSSTAMNRKNYSKPQYKRAVERTMTISTTTNSSVQQQQRPVNPNVMANRTNITPQRTAGIAPHQQQQQKLANTMQNLASAASSTPPQISRILNNAELTLTPIARSEASPTSTVDIMLRSNPNMQLAENGPQKPVQINVNSSMVGLQPLTATARKQFAPNILAKRQPPGNTNIATNNSSSLQANSLGNRRVNSSGGTFAVPQSQPNVYKVVPSNASRPVLKPPDYAGASFQMNSSNQSSNNSMMPLWHHPVSTSGTQSGPSQMAARQTNQIGPPSANNMNVRPMSLPSSHQSQGPNRYPSTVGQNPVNVSLRYPGPVRMPPPPPPYGQPATAAHGQYAQPNRQQLRPPVHHTLQNMSGMPAPSQGKERIVKCRICGCLFPTVAALQNHFEQTHANGIHQQQAQNVTPTSSNTLLLQQLQKLHPPQQTVLQQSQQLQPVQQSHQMQQVELTQQLQKQASYVCRRCHKTAQSYLHLQSHENVCLEKVPCMKCNELVFKDELLSHYSKVHHNGSPGPQFRFEGGPQSDGNLTNTISPNNPMFTLPPQVGLPISSGFQVENSMPIDAGLPQITTGSSLMDNDPPAGSSSQQQFVGGTLQDMTEQPLAITGFSLNEASESLVSQMSIVSDPLLLPPPLVKLSAVDSIPEFNGDCTSVAIRDASAQMPSDSMVYAGPSHEQYFTNADVAEDGMQYPIIQSVHSLIETSETEALCEAPLSPVVALVDELVKTIEDECSKDISILDEASGLFFKASPELPICVSEDASNSNRATFESSPTSEQPDVPMDVAAPESGVLTSEPSSAATDSMTSVDGMVPLDQQDDSAWLHEPLSEDDSCDKPSTPHEEFGTEAENDIAVDSQPEIDFEKQATGAPAMVVSQSVDSQCDNSNSVHQETAAVDGLVGGDSVENTKLPAEEDKDPSVLAAKRSRNLLAGEQGLVDSAEKSDENENDTSLADVDVDSRSGSQTERAISVHNDSDTDTVALEEDGETSEPASAEVKPATCPICDLEFDTRVALVEHSRIHLNTPTYECRFCSNAFSTAKLLSNHLRTHMRSCRDPPRNFGRKRRRSEDFNFPGAPENLAIALFDYDKVAENSEFLRRLGIYGFMRLSDMKDFFAGKRRRTREPPLINLRDDED